MRPDLELALALMAALAVILTASTICGRLALWVGQPRVVGEMVAGILLGPTVFATVAPDTQASIFAPDVKSVLYVLSTIGLTYYMFLTGAAIDHSFLRIQQVRRSALVALAGIVPPFALGAFTGWAYHNTFAGPNTDRLAFAIFLGGALSITAFPMLARILQERGIASSNIGSLTLLAGAVDDVVAWSLLAVVSAMATASGMGNAAIMVLGAVGFAVVMLTAGRRALAVLGRRVDRRGSLSHGEMAVVLVIVIVAGWITDMIGIHSVFGGFICGLAIPHSPTLRRELRTRLMDVNMILLLPIFFAFSGLNTEIGGLTNWSTLLAFLVIMIASVAGKYGACAMATRLLGHSWREASAVGGLMNARGMMILIFVNIGLAHQMITKELFSILVLVGVATTAAALPIFRRSLPDSYWEKPTPRVRELVVSSA
ncbi:MAG TPA: cation:proton antiporter [Micromonosporaceae bacterium]